MSKRKSTPPFDLFRRIRIAWRNRKHKHDVGNDPFSCVVTYIGYRECSGATISGTDYPVPSGTKFKLWHMIAKDGRVFIGTKMEEKILWFIPLEYCKHVWQVRPGSTEWDDPGNKLAKAYDWATCFDRNWGGNVGYSKCGMNCQFTRESDGYVEGFHNDYTLWQPS